MLRIYTFSTMVLIGLFGFVVGEEAIQQDGLIWTRQNCEVEDQNVWDKSCSYMDTEFCCDTTCCNPCSCFWVEGDLLFFKPCVGSFLTCMFGSIDTTVTTDAGGTSTLIIANDIKVPYQWDVGFRIGAGTTFWQGCYELAVYWTRFHTDAKNGNILSWKLDYDVLDVALAKKFNRCCCFSWAPFIGVRTVWIQQDLHVNFVSTSIVSDVTTETLAIDDNNQRLTATGPVAGIEADWDLGCGFGIYALADAAVVYGRNCVFAGEVETTSDSEDVTTVRSNRTLCACVFAADAGIGLSWKRCLCDNIFLTLRLGYEFQRYFDYNMINCHGDLSLNGGSLSAKLEF